MYLFVKCYIKCLLVLAMSSVVHGITNVEHVVFAQALYHPDQFEHRLGPNFLSDMIRTLSRSMQLETLK